MTTLHNEYLNDKPDLNGNLSSFFVCKSQYSCSPCLWELVLFSVPVGVSTAILRVCVHVCMRARECIGVSPVLCVCRLRS